MSKSLLDADLGVPESVRVQGLASLEYATSLSNRALHDTCARTQERNETDCTPTEVLRPCHDEKGCLRTSASRAAVTDSKPICTRVGHGLLFHMKHVYLRKLNSRVVYFT